MEISTTSITNPEAPADNEDVAFSLGTDTDDLWGNQYLDDAITKYTISEDTLRYQVSKIRITEDSPEVLIKFGHPPVQHYAHYLEFPDETYGAYYRCIGEDCPACAAGMKRVVRRVDFFYSVSSEDVAYHAYTADRKPNGFASKLTRACMGGYPAVLLVSRPDQYTYDIKRFEDQGSLEKAARVVKIFLEDLGADRVDLDEIVQAVDRQSMLLAPKIKAILTLKGIA